MVRRREDRKKKKVEKTRDWTTFNRHVRAMALKSELEYRAWCRANGCKDSVEKSARDRRDELRLRADERARADLHRRRGSTKHRRAAFERLCVGDTAVDTIGDRLMRRVAEASRRFGNNARRRRAFLRLLLVVEPKRKLLTLHPAMPAFGRNRYNNYIDALAALARHHVHWIRDPEAWTSRSRNAHRQFASLVRHLLVRWDIPEFMDSAWFVGPRDRTRQQRWYMHMGRGGSLRTVSLPVTLTRRMHHEFLEAPGDLTVPEALRWGQVKALGGDERLARALFGTRLHYGFEHDEFWTTVIRFFAENPALDRTQVGPIVDFIHNRKFVSAEECWHHDANVEQDAPPAQPGFSMKGRSAGSLLHQVEAWHRALARETLPERGWSPTGIPGFRFRERDRKTGEERLWIVRELLTNQELVAEGRALHHCVASYSFSCAKGHCSIWSIRFVEQRRERPSVTVEINPRSRQIVEARAKYNEDPGSKATHVMKLWARKANLVIASWV